MNEAVNEAYEKFRGDDGGKNADYIPFLANVPSQLFGISVCLPDGEIVEAGDTDYVFGVESVSKVPTAILAMEQYGPDTVLDQIGAERPGCLSTRSWPSCSRTTTLRLRSSMRAPSRRAAW